MMTGKGIPLKISVSSISPKNSAVAIHSVDYHSRQSAIYQLRTLNNRSVLVHADSMTDQEMIVKAQLNTHMRTRMRHAAPRKASWPPSFFFF